MTSGDVLAELNTDALADAGGVTTSQIKAAVRGSEDVRHLGERVAEENSADAALAFLNWVKGYHMGETPSGPL